jgi:hypothetical protein
LEWGQPGTVWAADLKQRREPIEGRYGWILAVKDLTSRYQLAWLPVEEATAEVVQATYAQLFAEHGIVVAWRSTRAVPGRLDQASVDGLGRHRAVQSAPAAGLRAARVFSCNSSAQSPLCIEVGDGQ